MEGQFELEGMPQELASWWVVSRRKLLRETLAQALYGKRAPRVLDLGCAADLDTPDVIAVNVHHALSVLVFHQTAGLQDSVCSRPEELAFASNSFDAVVCGDVLQSAAEDSLVLREVRRVLKDGGLLCLTVPAYMFLWGEEDEARGHERRYTASDLRRKLNSCGFEIHRVSYFVAAGVLPAFVQRIGRDTFRKTVAKIPLAATSSRAANAVMVSVLDVERQFMRYINLPFGTRLVAWARKPALVTERVALPAWERQWARQPLPQGSNYAATCLPETPTSG